MSYKANKKAGVCDDCQHSLAHCACVFESEECKGLAKRIYQQAQSHKILEYRVQQLEEAEAIRKKKDKESEHGAKTT